MVGISIREFARRDGCSDTMVHKRLKSGHLQALSDGRLDSDLVGSDWRPRRNQGANPPANSSDRFAGFADSSTVERMVGGFMDSTGRRLWSKSEAERVKENYLALLRQLESERRSSEVVLVEDAMIHVRAEYSLIRERLGFISAEVVPQLTRLRSAEECKAVIDDAIHKALTELTDIVP